MSSVQPVALSEALKISLNNYYDILKNQVGGLGSDEFLQLKLVADPIDINDSKYRYWSQYNLLQRSDLAIEPVPVSGTILTSADQLSQVYGGFLQRLRNYVIRKELSSEQQAQVADLDQKIARKKQQAREYQKSEMADWRDYCQTYGTKPGDMSTYIQWSVNFGYSKEITEIVRDLKQLYFDKKTILDKQYADPEDRQVVDAEFDYESLQMRLRYPIHPDYEYSEAAQFSLEYLARLPEGSSALYDDRRALTWNVSLPVMAGPARTLRCRGKMGDVRSEA
ncbi:MAG: hypothetical protein JSS49_28240 [Planctomycetes bacterium]|nr:hypothetical protein [Planctomycetota bacterium]